MFDIKPIHLYHIMKTAGRALQASVFQACAKIYGIKLTGPEIYNQLNDGSDNVVKIGPYLMNGPNCNNPIIAGHYPAWRIATDRLTVTILRHPLSRLISLIRMYAVEHPFHPWWRIFSDLPQPTPNRFLELAPDCLICNDVFMFSEALNPEEAAQNINALDLLIWQDSFDEGLQKLSSLMNLPLENCLFGENINKTLSVDDFLSYQDFITQANYRLAPSFKLIQLLL